MQVLRLLGFDLTFPTVFSFLDRFILLANLSHDTQAKLFCQYLTELTLIETKI
jgi:hypothetical protein